MKSYRSIRDEAPKADKIETFLVSGEFFILYCVVAALFYYFH